MMRCRDHYSGKRNNIPLFQKTSGPHGSGAFGIAGRILFLAAFTLFLCFANTVSAGEKTEEFTETQPFGTAEVVAEVAGSEPTVTPETTVTPKPTVTPEPTVTQEPTVTPDPRTPTASPVPSSTPRPVDGVKTADSAETLLWWILIAVSGAVLAKGVSHFRRS